jgi:hypothetical protein
VKIAADFKKARRETSTCDQQRLVPAPTAVPAAAAQQQNDKYDDENRREIHERLPSLPVFACALRNQQFWLSANV